MKPTIEAMKKVHGAIIGDGSSIGFKQGTMTPEVDFEQRLVSGRVSVATRDMDGEIVMPAGMNRSYFPDKVKAVYYGHNYEAMPVGVCRHMTLRDNNKSMWAQTYILPGARGDDLLTAMKHGAINGFSIGFKIDEAGPPTVEETKEYGECDTMIRKGTLIEYSITPMPSCPDALMDLATKGLIHRTSLTFFNLPTPPERKVFAVPTVVKVGNLGYIKR